VKTIPEAAELLNVGDRTVKRGRMVLEKGSPKLIKAINSGKINLHVATKIAKHDKSTQDKIVARVDEGEKATEAHRVVKSQVLVERQLARPKGKYRIIYADPPWDYGQHEMPNSDARDHYPTMTIDELCELPVEEWVEDDAVLFMWVTVPFTEKAFRFVHACGFEFKTEFVWDKITHNLGHYSSVRHEKLYVCTRGACQPDVRKLFDSVQSIERTEHSVKPEKFREIIDTLYPIGRRLELFCRGAVPAHWDSWGNEATEAAA
jgi:N6-adenosine-specific RNA methylase IME4